MHDVRNRPWIKRAELGIARHFHVLQKFPNRRIGKSRGLKLLVGHFAIDQRDRGNVWQAVVGRFARFRSPFFRFAPDDIDRGIVRFDVNCGDLRNVADLFAQKQRRFDRALAMIFRRPIFDARVHNYRRWPLGSLWERHCEFGAGPVIPARASSAEYTPCRAAFANATPFQCESSPTRACRIAAQATPAMLTACRVFSRSSFISLADASAVAVMASRPFAPTLSATASTAEILSLGWAGSFER